MDSVWQFMCVTYYLPANPVVSVVKGVSFSLKQFSEQSPQIFIVRLFKEVQPSHISQVSGHLLWITQKGKKNTGLTFVIDTVILIMLWDDFSNNFIWGKEKQVKSQPISVMTIIQLYTLIMCISQPSIISVPGKFSQRTSMGVFRFVSPIFWYRSFNVSACSRFKSERHVNHFWCRAHSHIFFFLNAD